MGEAGDNTLSVTTNCDMQAENVQAKGSGDRKVLFTEQRHEEDEAGGWAIQSLGKGSLQEGTKTRERSLHKSTLAGWRHREQGCVAEG